MKNTNLKKIICAAVAGIMLALTACGEVKESPTENNGNSKTTTTTAETVLTPDEPAPDESTPDDEDVTGGSSKAVVAEPDTKPDDEFYEAYNNYAAELFIKTCDDDLREGKNAMISPESVMMALGMTANGAKGETLTQMEEALGGTPIDKLNTAMQYRMARFNNAEDVSFNVANSVWVRDDAERIKMSEDFCGKARDFYGAESFLAPFDRSTVSDINNWVSEQTKQMIPSIIDQIPDDAMVYLINAIAFEGKWAEGYKDYQIHADDKFTNSKGEEEKVDMLYSEEGYYIAEDGVTGFIKPYMGYEYGFMALLPEEGTDLADFTASLDGEKLRKFTSDAGGDVNVCIPEFTFDYDNELSEELQSMGMVLPFEGGDFSGMADCGDGNLEINRVLHKTHIELDREGTKAAAATAVEMTCEAAIEIEEPKYVYLNRPFAFAIVDLENGSPIFIGGVNTIKNS